MSSSARNMTRVSAAFDGFEGHGISDRTPLAFAAGHRKTDVLLATMASDATPVVLPLAHQQGSGTAAIVTLQLPRTPRAASHQTEVLHQYWECIVTRISEDSLTARLRSLLLPNEDLELEADVLLDDVSDDDRELIELGAIFYWRTGYSTSSAGTRTRFSAIKFRRLPVWSEKDLARASAKGAALFAKFGKPSLPL